MIKVFRKIRQNMLIQNKLSQYLAYAIGEIILVVIGILIALSVNNLNQKNKERELEQEYIASLIEDAKTDLANFNAAIELNKERTNSLDSLKYGCYNYHKEDYKDPELILWYIKCLRRPDFVTQTDRTLSQLKNSGGMRLIADKTKIDAIVTYEQSFERLHNQQGWYEDGLKELVDAGIPVFNYSYFPKSFKEFDSETFYKTARIQDCEPTMIINLGNRASIFYLLTFSYLNYLNEGKAECEKLISTLEKSTN